MSHAYSPVVYRLLPLCWTAVTLTSSAFAAGPVVVLGQTAPARKSLAESLPDEARVEYEGGKLLFQDGDMAGALLKFLRAYERSKEARVLWNIAVCEKRLRHYGKVIAYLERYRIEGAAVLEAEELRDAAELIAELRPFTGTIRLKVNQPLAEVSVDGEVMGTTPFDRPLIVDIGRREIRVTREGFVPVTRQIMVTGPEEQPLDIQLSPELHEGQLFISTDPNAAIYVDDEAVGAERWDSKVKSGKHTVRVRSAEGAVERRDVVVNDGEARIVQISFPKEGALKTGGGLGTGGWLAIVGSGAALVAGGVVATVLLSNRVKDPQQGTMNPGVIQLP